MAEVNDNQVNVVESENKAATLEQEIIKIRTNKVLAQYLNDTKQFLLLDPITMQIGFHEIIEMTPKYIKSGGKERDWGILLPPSILQHPAQHQILSDVVSGMKLRCSSQVQ